MFNLHSLRTYTKYEQEPLVFLERALSLARASELAYEDHAAIITEALDLPTVTTFDAANVQGYWFVHEDIALLVFRGSANKQHWLDNFRVIPPNSDNHTWGMAHPGFLASISQVIDPVLKPFACAAAKQSHVWLAGHSLGGALAVLSAAWFKIETKFECHLHTYGQPMPGFENFSLRFDSELNDRHTRFINQRDIVPTVPGVGYRHCGRAKTITSVGTLQKLGATQAFVLASTDATAASATDFESFLNALENMDANAFAAVRNQGLIASRLPWFAHHSITRYILELSSIQRGLLN
jgi:hypothetical protein